MYRPLQSIKDLMESFSAHLERWAHRIKVSLFVTLDGCGLGLGVCCLLFADVCWVVGENSAY